MMGLKKHGNAQQLRRGCARQQGGHAALRVLGGVFMAGVAVLLLWLWLPLLISVAAGALVFVLLV